MHTSVGDPSLAPVADPLKGTRLWVQIISIIFFISAALMILGAIVMIIGFGSASSAINEAARASGQPAQPFAGAIMKAGGVVYLIFGALYLVPAVLTWKYARAITRFSTVQTVPQLVLAMDAQRRVWKLFGILALIGIILTFVVVGGLVISAVAASSLGGAATPS
jgi:hypothetical protein